MAQIAYQQVLPADPQKPISAGGAFAKGLGGGIQQLAEFKMRQYAQEQERRAAQKIQQEDEQRRMAYGQQLRQEQQVRISKSLKPLFPELDDKQRMELAGAPAKVLEMAVKQRMEAPAAARRQQAEGEYEEWLRSKGGAGGQSPQTQVATGTPGAQSSGQQEIGGQTPQSQDAPKVQAQPKAEPEDEEDKRPKRKWDKFVIPRGLTRDQLERRYATWEAAQRAKDAKFDDRLEKVDAKHRKKYQEIDDAARSAVLSQQDISEMRDLVLTDKMPPTLLASLVKSVAKGEWGIGLDLRNLMSDEARTFDKITMQFLKSLKALFPGGKITNLEMQNFLKMLPDLTMTNAGKLMVIRMINATNALAMIKGNLNESIAAKTGDWLTQGHFRKLNKAMKPFYAAFSKEKRMAQRKFAGKRPGEAEELEKYMKDPAFKQMRDIIGKSGFERLAEGGRAKYPKKKQTKRRLLLEDPLGHLYDTAVGSTQDMSLEEFKKMGPEDPERAKRLAARKESYRAQDKAIAEEDKRTGYNQVPANVKEWQKAKAIRKAEKEKAAQAKERKRIEEHQDLMAAKEEWREARIIRKREESLAARKKDKAEKEVLWEKQLKRRIETNKRRAKLRETAGTIATRKTIPQKLWDNLWSPTEKKKPIAIRDIMSMFKGDSRKIPKRDLESLRLKLTKWKKSTVDRAAKRKALEKILVVSEPRINPRTLKELLY